MAFDEKVMGKQLTELAVTEVKEVVFESGNIQEFREVILWMKNTGSDAITVAEVEISPDSVDWYMFDNSKFILAGGAKDYLLIPAVPFFRVSLQTAVGQSTTVDIGYTVNSGMGVM